MSAASRREPRNFRRRPGRCAPRTPTASASGPTWTCSPLTGGRRAWRSTRPSNTRRGGWLEAGLGALVFLPLLFTWHGLTQASSAYGALTGDNPKAAARPFLQLWQSGFEGHLAGLCTFGTVATSATVAIAVLFALALVHSFRKAARARRLPARPRRHPARRPAGRARPGGHP
ncbi:hypothetical protein ACFWVU_37575 [Streptomyces sp. NPDC058686]|uniref:hypothetical protein n=1 Tax=Streptomyces sp. NPDC058686 TaxID=3346599 RepID=UPI00365AA61A